MPDLRNSTAKARDAFIESDEGKQLTDPISLGARPDQRQYLRNRIETAFLAGVKAAGGMPPKSP